MIEYFDEAKKKKKTKPEQDTVINNPKIENNEDNKQEIDKEDIKEKLMLLASNNRNKYNKFISSIDDDYRLTSTLNILYDDEFDDIFKLNKFPRYLDKCISYIAKDEYLLNELNELTNQIPKENDNIEKAKQDKEEKLQELEKAKQDKEEKLQELEKAKQDKEEKLQELEKVKQEKEEREDELMAPTREAEANRKQLENNINYFLNSKDESGNFIWDGLNTAINKILINLTNIFNCITDILKKDDFKEDIQKSNNILNEFYTKVKNIKIENNNCFIKFYEICQQINMSIDNSKDQFKSSNLNINDNDTEASIDLKALESMKETIKNKTKDDQSIESFNQTILNIINLFTKIQEISSLKKSLITNIIREYNKLYNKKK